MKWLLLILPLCAAAASATAQSQSRPDYVVGSAPEGWQLMAGLGSKVATNLSQARVYGGEATATTVAHADPGTGAFYLSWLASSEAVAEPSVAVRGALDWARQSAQVDGPDGETAIELSYDEAVEGNLAMSSHTFRQPASETETMARTFAWVDGEGIGRLVRAECVISAGGDETEAARQACRTALSSVDVSPRPADAAAIALAQPVAAGASEEATADQTAPTTTAPGASLGPAPEGQPRVLYQGPEAAGERSVAKWLIIGGALILAAAFLFTSRRRKDEP